MRNTTRIPGTGNYLVTVTRTDGTKEQHRDTSKDQAIATARTWSLIDGVASAEVGTVEGTACTPEPTHPTHEQITRTSLEAHQTLMAVNPDNVERFKDVTRFLAEDLKTLEKGT